MGLVFVVIVHDPAGFVATPLPLSDFLAGWQRDIYTGKPYGLVSPSGSRS
jgi:hypothetical protein